MSTTIFDPTRAPRIWAAWQAATALLDEPRAYPDVLKAMTQTGVAARTAKNILYSAKTRGWITISGKYEYREYRDGRVIHLTEPNPPEIAR